MGIPTALKLKTKGNGYGNPKKNQLRLQTHDGSLSEGTREAERLRFRQQFAWAARLRKGRPRTAMADADHELGWENFI
jgi:hypothetical protein